MATDIQKATLIPDKRGSFLVPRSPVGRGIVEKQQALGWGESVIEKIAKDLQTAFPEVAGFSARNLRSVRQFFSAYSSSEFWLQAVAKLPANDGPRGRTPIWLQPVAKLKNSPELLAEPAVLQFLQQVVAEIPWGQHLLILNKTTDHAARLYYLQATAQFGWSRNVLLNQIKAKAYERARLEKKTHNFALALPEDLAEQAEEALKSSYNLEFLGIGRIIKERALEDGLIRKVIPNGRCQAAGKHHNNIHNRELRLVQWSAAERRARHRDRVQYSPGPSSWSDPATPSKTTRAMVVVQTGERGMSVPRVFRDDSRGIHISRSPNSTTTRAIAAGTPNKPQHLD